MALTPQITLTANLESIVGAAAVGGYLRVTLCGYGPQPPAVPGTCMLANAGVPQLEGPQVGTTPISIQLFGNDVITPSQTFYEISVLDQNQDVIQSAIYQFNGSGTTDLSDAPPILPPFNLGFVIATMKYVNCNIPPRLPNTVFIAPGPVIAVAYNGIFLGPEYYTIVGSQINLTFQTELGDRIDAFCVMQNATFASPPGGAPVIPGTAISSGILDNYGPQPWLSTHDSGTPGTSTGTSTYISPTVGRNFNFTYTGNGGQRYSLYFADDTTSQNYCFDLYVAFDDPTQILNMELDMNQVLADGRTVILDCQCAHVSQTWEYNSWVPSAIPGDPQTWGIGVYHHVRIFWHRDITGNLTTWDGVEFDGVYTPFGVAPANTAQALGWAVGRLVCNFQIEGASSASGTVSAYGKNMTVWRW